MKMHLPRQHEACALALPYVGVGLNILFIILLPIGLMYQYWKGRYFMMERNRGLVFSILLYSPLVSIPSLVLFNFLFTWHVNLLLVSTSLVSATIVSMLLCYQLLRSAESKLYLETIKEQ